MPLWIIKRIHKNLPRFHKYVCLHSVVFYWLCKSNTKESGKYVWNIDTKLNMHQKIVVIGGVTLSKLNVCNAVIFSVTVLTLCVLNCLLLILLLLTKLCWYFRIWILIEPQYTGYNSFHLKFLSRLLSKVILIFDHRDHWKCLNS